MCARIAPTTALIYLGSRYGVPIPPVSQTLGFRAALHTRTEDAVLGDWIDHVRHGDEQGSRLVPPPRSLPVRKYGSEC